MDLSNFSFFFWFRELVMSSKVCIPDNSESLVSLNLRFTNIQLLCLNFVGCEIFPESNSSERLSFFNSKEYITQIHSLVLYVKEGLTFAWDSSLENSEYSYLCFQLALFCSVFYFFSIYQSMPSCLCSVLDFISSSKDEILSMNP